MAAKINQIRGWTGELWERLSDSPALPRIVEMSPSEGLFTESLMAAAASNTPEAQETIRETLRNGFAPGQMFGIGRVISDTPAPIAEDIPRPQFFDVSSVYRPADRVAFYHRPENEPRPITREETALALRNMQRTANEVAMRYMPPTRVLVNPLTMQDIQSLRTQAAQQPPQGGEPCPQSNDGPSAG